MFDGEGELVSEPMQVKIGVAPRVELGGAAQGLAGPHVAGAFPGMASEDMLGAAQKTGGETVNADDPGHTFREMLRRMRKRYSIYYAMPADKPGAARQVTVGLAAGAKGRYPGAEVLARKGYLIPKAH